MTSIDAAIQLLNRLASAPPALIWGVLSRGLGLVFLISFCSLGYQVLPIAGRAGLTPIEPALRAIERDFPSWRRFAYFPTLLWFNASDRSLQLLCASGGIAAGSLIVGGPHAPWAFAICYLVYLSLDRALTLIYPWDCVLFEAGFWGIFLPATQLLPAVQAVSAPLPAVAWVYRLLLFRVMFGFGKHKFTGFTAQDAGFLKGFLVNQPLPSYLGWFAQKGPIGLMKFGALALFLVEIPLPFASFFPGPWSAFAALATIGLMVVIWLTGSFGHFNIAMIVVALSWFDTETAQCFSTHALFAPGAAIFVHALFVLHTALASIALPFNTFCAYTWMMWAPWTRIRPRFLTWPFALMRVLQPWRLVHPYGVFPPQTAPAARITPVVELSWDGSAWHELAFRFWPSQETSPPRFCAPHHPRLDQAVVYEAMGMNELSPYRNVAGRWDPYGHGGVSAAMRLVHQLLTNEPAREAFFARSPERQAGLPLAVRVREHMLEPTTLRELHETGRWWTRTLVGSHFPVVRLGDAFWDAPVTPPELWHFDDIVWLRRSRLGDLMRRAHAGEDAHALVRAYGELRADDVALFWQAFVPQLPTRHRTEWTALRASVSQLREQYGRARLYAFERIANLYGVLLFAKLEPLFNDRGLAPIFGKVQATLNVPSNYHLRLLTHQIVADGQAIYDAVMREPSLAREQAEKLTMFSGHVFHALFRYETLVYQSQKFRMVDSGMKMPGRPAPTDKQREARQRGEAIVTRAFGALAVVEFLKTQFTCAEDVLDVPERLPLFRLTESTEVVRIPWPDTSQDC
jgi:hypothetical protein